jgi:hypothetical protein
MPIRRTACRVSSGNLLGKFSDHMVPAWRTPEPAAMQKQRLPPSHICFITLRTVVQDGLGQHIEPRPEQVRMAESFPAIPAIRGRAGPGYGRALRWCPLCCDPEMGGRCFILKMSKLELFASAGILAADTICSDFVKPGFENVPRPLTPWSR